MTYDSDGNGAGQGIIIATLGVNMAITNADFVRVLFSMVDDNACKSGVMFHVDQHSNYA